MNSIQVDELLAIESIYPNCLTKKTFIDHLEIKIKVEIDWGEEREVKVIDYYQNNINQVENLKKVNEFNRVDEVIRLEGSKDSNSIELEKVIDKISITNGKKNVNNRKGKQQQNQNNNNSIPSNTSPSPIYIPPPLLTLRKKSVVVTLSPTGCTPIISAPSTITTPLSPTSIPFTLTSTSLSSIPTSPPPAESVPKSIPNRIPISMKIRYLPPLELKVTLGEGYPTNEPPRFSLSNWSSMSQKEESMDSEGENEKIRESGWLSDSMIKILEGILNELWQHEECLWLAIDLLRGESLIELLDLKFPLLLEQATTKRTSSIPLLSSQLKAHDRLSKTDVFKTENYECGICLEEKKGSRCIRLRSCGDVFCQPCLLSYFTLLITEGLVRSVHCPSVACVRSRALFDRAHPPSVYSATATTTSIEAQKEVRPGEVGKEELEEIVGFELTKRWEDLSEKMRIDSDLSFSRCPREACQAPVPSGDESKLRICTSCGYSYCVFCRKGWHGTINQCSIPQSSLIVSAFLLGTPSEQSALEIKYGKANMRRLVAVFEEDRLNREWVEKNSKSCPGCLIRVERTEGCAHMQCNRCQIHFCYLCGSKISALDPYLHYSTPGAGCFNKLFEGVPNPNYY